MKKIALLIIPFLFLVGCGKQEVQTLDLKDLNRVDESVKKKVVKVDDDRPAKEVLEKGIANWKDDKGYELNSVATYTLEGGYNKKSPIAVLNGMTMTMNQKVDTTKNRMEYSMNTKASANGVSISLRQTYHYVDGKMYLGNGNMLPEEISKYANKAPVLIDEKGKQLLGMDDSLEQNMKDIIKDSGDEFLYSDKTKIVRKELSESEVKKGYRNAIAIKLDTEATNVAMQQLQNLQDTANATGEVKESYLVYWLDEKDNIKKIMTQMKLDVTGAGEQATLTLKVEQTYEEKANVQFSMNELDKYYNLSELVK